MSAALLDISFFCLLFNVTRLSLCKSGEKRESSMHIFAHERKADSCQQSCVLLSKRIRMNNDHTAHWSMMKRFDIVKPHVALLRVPRSEWVILREGRLAHRTPFRPKSDRCVSRSRGSLSALEPSDPGQMYIRKCRALPFCSASVKSKIQHCRRE